jgi:hypothetical protein
VGGRRSDLDGQAVVGALGGRFVPAGQHLGAEAGPDRAVDPVDVAGEQLRARVSSARRVMIRLGAGQNRVR